METLAEFCKKSAWRAWEQCIIDTYEEPNQEDKDFEATLFEEWWNEELTDK